MKAEEDNIPFTFKNKIKILLLNPIYITLYIPFAIESFFKKNVGWQVIKHGEAKTAVAVEKEKVEENDEVSIEQ